MDAQTIEIHGAFADRSYRSTDAALAGVTVAAGPRRPSLGTLLQGNLLADAARDEPRLYLLFATAQRDAGRPYAQRVATAAELKRQAHDLAGWFVVLAGRAAPRSWRSSVTRSTTCSCWPVSLSHPAAEPMGDVAPEQGPTTGAGCAP